MPTLDGVDMAQRYPSATLPYPDDMRPGFEFSEHVRVTGDRQQWMDELGKAQAKLNIARDTLRPLADNAVPATADEMKLAHNAPLADALRSARKIVNAGPNERPKFHPDGTMYAEDAAKLAKAGDWSAAGKLIAEPSAAVHLETVTFRLPRLDLRGYVKAAALDQAREATQNYSHVLTFKDAHLVDPALDRPSPSRAIQELDRIDSIIKDAIDESKKSIDARGLSKYSNMLNDRIYSLTQQRAKIAIAAGIAAPFAIGAAVAYAARKND